MEHVFSIQRNEKNILVKKLASVSTDCILLFVEV
jgi:hypothetical protein